MCAFYESFITPVEIVLYTSHTLLISQKWEINRNPVYVFEKC